MSDKPGIDSIFCSAIEIESPAERQALVAQACGEDVELRHQVERLLHVLITPAVADDVALEHFEEGMGTAAGGVLFLPQRHEAGTHGAAPQPAALAHAHAAQRRPRETPPRRAGTGNGLGRSADCS